MFKLVYLCYFILLYYFTCEFLYAQTSLNDSLIIFKSQENVRQVWSGDQYFIV